MPAETMMIRHCPACRGRHDGIELHYGSWTGKRYYVCPITPQFIYVDEEFVTAQENYTPRDRRK